jgi:hypothetical protein
MQIFQTTVIVIVYLRQKTSSDKIRKRTLYVSGLVNILKYWPAALRKTNRENKNLKYKIVYYELQHPLNTLYSLSF